jgi:hypothetical protein
MWRPLVAIGTWLTKVESWLALAGMATSTGLFVWLGQQWSALAEQGWPAIIMASTVCSSLLMISLSLLYLAIARYHRPTLPQTFFESFPSLVQTLVDDMDSLEEDIKAIKCSLRRSEIMLQLEQVKKQRIFLQSKRSAIQQDLDRLEVATKSGIPRISGMLYDNELSEFVDTKLVELRTKERTRDIEYEIEAGGWQQGMIQSETVYRSYRTQKARLEAMIQGISEALSELDRNETICETEMERNLLSKIDPIAPDHPKTLRKKYR